jgi:opacity protein-like surface antigen
MRGLLWTAAIMMMASAAHAADMPDLPILRGAVSEGLSKSSPNWDGFYAGGNVGYTSDSTDFSKSIVGLSNYIFRDSILQQPTADWSLLSKTTATQNANVGLFFGRNWQWYDAILSLEVNYSYFNNLNTFTSGTNTLDIVNPPGSVPPAGATDHYVVTLTGTAAAQVKDMLTFRGRVGWDGGDFMPYMFSGLAIGRMDVSRTVTSNVTFREDTTVTTIDPFTFIATSSVKRGTTLPIPSLSQMQQQRRTNNFVPGWEAGIGFEYRLWAGLFARAEWEYVKFSPVMNTSVTLNNVRAGLGYKF